AAGAVVDDDAIAGPLLDVLGEQAPGDVHAAARGVNHGELDRLRREILRLELRELGLGGPLRERRRDEKSCNQCSCDVLHEPPPPVGLDLRRSMRAASTTLAASSAAVTGLCSRIIAPSGDMTSDWRSDCSSSGASTNAMTKGAR